MPGTRDLKGLESHFAFGDNWAAYAANISPADIEEATEGLRRLLGATELEGKRFLDIGSGSGIHSLAALKLGAKEVVAIDIDPASINTTRQVLEKYAPHGRYVVKQVSIFDLQAADFGLFEVVYSWGVLHHTGDMYRAIRIAAALVAAEGELVFALYHKTMTCRAWTAEKRWYSRASNGAQAIARSLYIGVAVIRRWLRGQSFKQYVQTYRGNRGMNFYHDVHDWLGGYPYESASPDHIEALMRSLGFARVRRFIRDWAGAQLGLFGTGCDEYVYRREASELAVPCAAVGERCLTV